MFCPACGSQLPETAKFCLECGVKLSTFAPGVHPEAGGNRTAPLGSPAIAAAAIAPVATAPSEGAAPALAATNASEAAQAQPAAMQGGGSTLHGTGGSPKRVSKTGTSMHGAQASQVFVDPGDDSVVVPMAGPSKRTLVLGGVGIAAVSLLVGAVGAWRAVKASRPQTTIAPPLQSESAVALLETPRSLPRATDPSVTRGSQGNGRPGTRASNGTGGTGGAGGSGGAEPNGSAANPGNTGNTNSGAGNSAGAGGAAGSGAQPNNGAGSANNSATRPSGGSGSQAGSGGATGGSNAGNTAQNGAGNTSGSGSAGGEIGSGGSAGGEVSGTRGPRAPASGGYVEGDATDATGTLSPSAFTFVYRHYRAQIASCHSSVTRGGQEVNGVLRLRVRIGTDGHVVRTRVLENTTRNEALATCVQNQVRTWRYPQPEGGEVEVDYPFGFGN